MAAKKSTDSRPAPPIVIYAPLGELKVYEISEGELEKLEAGPPGQLHLNFALAMLPTALTIFITLQTADFAPAWRIGYQIACWALGVQGLIAFAQWWRSSRSYRSLIQDIRARMPDSPLSAEQIPPEPTTLVEREASIATRSNK